MDEHRTEFAVTLRALADYLPPAPARVLDCGGGPGRYAIELAGRGYQVVLFDLSARCLQLAREKAAESGVTPSGFEQGNATNLSRFPDDSFDVVLLMGPLYHLLGEQGRRQALAEASRVLRPGGLLFATWIARYAVLRYAAAREPSLPIEQAETIERILTSGVLPPAGRGEKAFVAHFAHPTEVAPLCQQAGFEVLAVLGVEGLVSMIEEGVNALSGRAWEAWVDLNYRLAADPSIQGNVEHLLAVAVKPRWRAVLRELAKRLNEAGVLYKVVGGASARLHGVQITVKDLDIETDDQGVFRFQELFSEEVREPVTFREGENYRSLFGRFDFEGVQVEAMGNLERREGDHWVPTSDSTETTVVLDGVPVRVPWLEETSLSYIRRGRLERAAQCLPFCSRERLLALLSGVQPTDVLPTR